eukprot:1687562-Amphidinium_carterae.1
MGCSYVHSLATTNASLNSKRNNSEHWIVGHCLKPSKTTTDLRAISCVHQNVDVPEEDLYPKTCSHVHVRYINWRNITTWVSQVRLMAASDIWMPSIGTGQYNHLLMPDGSVTVNLGWREPDVNYFPTYGEDHLLASNARVCTFPCT